MLGTTRRSPEAEFKNLERLGIRDRLTLLTVSMADLSQVQALLNTHAPDEIYNLAGQSSVGRSFELPKETHDSIAVAALNLLQTVRDLGLSSRVFMAGSGDMFGNLNGCPARESTALNPVSPYGRAKATAFEQTRKYRDSHGIFACTAILFNHESFLRPSSFVTRKIVKAACAIARGRARELRLGNIDIQRDWGWAPEYVDAMWRMLQQDEPGDYVIATGTTIRLAEFIQTVFSHLDLNWQQYVKTDEAMFRPADIQIMAADPSSARLSLGWQARFNGHDVARMMVEAELEEDPLLTTHFDSERRLI